VVCFPLVDTCTPVSQKLGCLKGSSFLNEAYRNHLKQRLIGEKKDIELCGFTLDGIIETEVVNFENKIKRNVDITNLNARQHYFVVQGLKTNPKKGFSTNKVHIYGYVLG
jgi:hypothetical protein